MKTVTVSFPPPTLAGPACQVCEGLGVTGETFQQPVDPDPDGDVVLIVDVFCPVCGGCGSGDPEHTTCDPALHPGNDLNDLDHDDEGEDEAPRCWSCWGRGWNAVQGFGGSDDTDPDADPGTVLTLRVPCGCTTSRAQIHVVDES